jgi:hypothetical protein
MNPVAAELKSTGGDFMLYLVHQAVLVLEIAEAHHEGYEHVI